MGRERPWVNDKHIVYIYVSGVRRSFAFSDA